VTDAKDGFESIDDYLAAFPESVRSKLEELRKVIREEAPDATERISYRMPTFYLIGNLVHFAAYAKHIGFYPAPSGIDGFREELARYATSKGAIRFPIDEPLPLDLIRRIVRFRVAENTKEKRR